MQWIRKFFNACGHFIKWTIIIVLIFFSIMIVGFFMLWGPTIINRDYDHGYAVREVYTTISGKYDIG